MEKILEKIKTARQIVILTHVSPDPDALGSSFALCAALSEIGKQAEVVLCEPIAGTLQYLAGSYRVYDPAETYKADLVICVDCGDEKRLDCAGAIAEKCKEDVINIDHHKDNTCFGTLNYVKPDTAASGELIFRLILKLKPALNNAEARWLYAALAGDTGGFRYSNTTPETMRIAAELMEYDFDFREISRELFDTVDYNLLKLRARLIDEVSLTADGRIASVAATNQLLREFSVKEEDVYDLVDIARSIRGVQIAISLKERGESIKVSLRSECEIDVAGIAKQFGGGGHVRAAGITLTGVTIEQARELVLAACVKELEGKGKRWN